MRLDALWQDLKYGARSLVRTPALTLSAVLALALGIGANAAIYSFVDALLLHPFAFDTAGLVSAVERSPGQDRLEVATGRFYEWQKRVRSLESLEGAAWWEVNLTGAEEAERAIGYRVTPGLFKALGTAPSLGRAFAPDEDQPGKDHVLLLADELWQRRFDRDPQVVGKTVLVDGESYTVVGVMPPGFRFPKAALLWAPLTFTAAIRDSRAGNHSVWAVGRLRAGQTEESAARDIAAQDLALRAEHPGEDPGHTVNVFPLRDYGDSLTRVMLWSLMAAVILVQLIACANVGNMLLARSAGRERELAVRAALGATRTQLMRQLLVESLLLSLAACALGLLFASWGIDLIRLPMPPEVARWISGWSRVGLDARVLSFSIALSILTAAIAGLLPALKSSRLDLHAALQGNSSSSTSSGDRSRIRKILVGAEAALALILAVAAGLMVQSTVRLLNAPMGFTPEGVLSLRLSPAEARYRTDAELNRFFAETLRRLRSLPGVQSVGAGAHLPQAGSSSSRFMGIEGQPLPPPEERVSVNQNWIEGDYFAALRVPILAGRAFGPADDVPGAPLVALLSEALAHRQFGTKDPIGARIRMGAKQDEPWRTVVGVVGEVRYGEIRLDTSPMVYLPNAQQTERTIGLVLRTTVPPMTLASAVRRELRALDPDQPVSDLKPLPAVVREQTIGYQYGAGLMSAFAFLALLLGGVGIGGVVAYSVRQRRREMAIRLALGASPGQVLRLALVDGMRPALIGLGAGLLGAAALTRGLTTLLYGVTALDPLTFAAAAAFLATIALAACWLPSRRAALADPLDALKAE